MTTDRARVVIAGGGVAALEALLALRELVGHRVAITLVSSDLKFVNRPATVAEAFDRGEARSYNLAAIVNPRSGGTILWDSLESVDAQKRTVLTTGGERIAYDALVVATGAIPRDPFAGAFTFRGHGDVAALRRLLDELTAGTARSVALTLPSQEMWPLPLYELALMTASHLRERGSDAEVWLVTPEETPLELFGPAAAPAIEPMLEARGIRLRTSALPIGVRHGMLVLAGGGAVRVDKVITLPRLEGPGLPGLPHDEHGFIPVDDHGRVPGATNVYAAGDVTAFPLKQGGLAAQQADAVAEEIAAALGVAITPTPFAPVLRGLLLTGGAPLYLRAEPHRRPHEAALSIEAPRSSRQATSEASAAADEPLWWPPAKIAGRYLGPFLANAQPGPAGSTTLIDRTAVAGVPVPEAEYADALGLTLVLADFDAGCGDYALALNSLDAAESLLGTLPPEYEAKRRRWRAARWTA